MGVLRDDNHHACATILKQKFHFQLLEANELQYKTEGFAIQSRPPTYLGFIRFWSK